MNYRHIDTLAQEDWFNRPWLMLGTGPSLDNFNPEDWRDHNIAAIYDAFYACDHIDVHFVSDAWSSPVFEYKYWRDPRSRYVATRAINLEFMQGETNIVMWDYTCDRDRLGVHLFKDRQPYPCSNTSSFIVMWLGEMGVRHIKTFGIDGGLGLSKHVSESYKRYSTPQYEFNPDVENEGVWGHAASFGIKIERQ